MVVVGRSNIVGKPVANMLLQKAAEADATVTVCHSRTRDLPSVTRQADILIAAIGVPEFVTADMVKEGAVVIDVGVNRVDDPSSPKGFRWVGDVKFDEVAGQGRGHQPGARRGGAHDHHHAAVQHGAVGQAPGAEIEGGRGPQANSFAYSRRGRFFQSPWW